MNEKKLFRQWSELANHEKTPSRNRLGCYRWSWCALLQSGTALLREDARELVIKVRNLHGFSFFSRKFYIGYNED
jgi:hypothetical protein